MDDDLNNLIADFGSAGVSQLNQHQVHPRFREFKNENKEKEKQRQRRQDALERQKSAREDFVLKLRGLINSTPKKDTSPGVQRPRPNREFADQFMTSEWLVDIPEDFEEWVMVPCPSARRCLLVASNGVTTAYSKKGFVINQFPSHLPGGNYSQHKNSLTILDCFITERRHRESSSETSKTSENPKRIWVVDLICWNDLSFTESEFDCRQFMLKSRLEENGNLHEQSAKNPYAIVALPWCYCKKEAMTEMMNREFDFELDGVLFYHPKVLYIPGQNAMIGWLEPWMMPEILDVPIPERLQKPENRGENAKDYMARFESVNSQSMYIGGADRYTGRLNIQKDVEMNEQSDKSCALDLSNT
uniref:Snurportin-1 n=1 Tax=Acrobeloides nanus TaxID=290746 RepID=A0A914E0R4_9BILA